MKKISTLFKKDPSDLGRVINEVDPQNDWVKPGNCLATRKWDGSACAIIGGDLYKRYDAKHGKKAPDGAIPCCEPDPITGHHPHWLKCDRNKKEDQFFWEGYDNVDYHGNGTYELCGPKVQGNPEQLENHILIPHGVDVFPLYDFSFENIKSLLERSNVEGIVFHHISDGRMCKIRKSDFGFKRYPLTTKTNEK